MRKPTNNGGKTCRRGHRYRGSGCPTCWKGHGRRGASSRRS